MPRFPQLRYVLAPGPTLASETLVPVDCASHQIEVCPQAGAVIEHMSDVIVQHGGCALIVDYGEENVNRHTLRVSYAKIINYVPSAAPVRI